MTIELFNRALFRFLTANSHFTLTFQDNNVMIVTSVIKMQEFETYVSEMFENNSTEVQFSNFFIA